MQDDSYKTEWSGGVSLMSFDVFINFDGDCRAAIEFYYGMVRDKYDVTWQLSLTPFE